MSRLDPFLSAQAAKERLQIIVQHESARHRGGDGNNDFIKKLQKELLDVISKYVNIDPEKIKVQLERTGDYSVLELNVTLPEFHERPIPAAAPVIAEPDVEDKTKAEKTTEETAAH